MTDFLSSEFWNDRYKDNQTGWDLGEISPPIKHYFDQLTNKDLRILIPGCGSGYEGEYLFRKGFRNVHLLDFAQDAIKRFSERVPEFPVANLHSGDFFEHSGSYDLIVEQTLFCAIDPTLRPDYAKKVTSLLVPGGKLVGVMFDRTFEGGPPFGGSKSEYEGYFQPLFSSVKMEKCHNSAAPRAGSELFVILKK